MFGFCVDLAAHRTSQRTGSCRGNLLRRRLSLGPCRSDVSSFPPCCSLTLPLTRSLHSWGFDVSSLAPSPCSALLTVPLPPRKNSCPAVFTSSPSARCHLPVFASSVVYQDRERSIHQAQPPGRVQRLWLSSPPFLSGHVPCSPLVIAVLSPASLFFFLSAFYLVVSKYLPFLKNMLAFRNGATYICILAKGEK